MWKKKFKQYLIIGNLRTFNQFSLTTVDNLFVREFYVSSYVSGRAPIHAVSPDVFPPEVQQIYNEFTPKPQNMQERQAMADKYFKLALKKIGEDPAGYIVSRIKKFWYVWEKHYIFYYDEPPNQMRDQAVYWVNIGLIFVGICGLLVRMREVVGKSIAQTTFGFLVIFLFAYISAVHSISLTEERFSLPGYPLLFLFAGYGVSRLLRLFIRR